MPVLVNEPLMFSRLLGPTWIVSELESADVVEKFRPLVIVKTPWLFARELIAENAEAAPSRVTVAILVLIWPARLMLEVPETVPIPPRESGADEIGRRQIEQDSATVACDDGTIVREDSVQSNQLAGGL